MLWAAPWTWILDAKGGVEADVHPLVHVSVYPPVADIPVYSGFLRGGELRKCPTLRGLLGELHAQAAVLLSKKMVSLSLVRAQGRYARLGESVSVTRPANADGSHPWTAYGTLAEVDARGGGSTVVDAEGHRHMVWLSDCVIEEPITEE
jgi:hypothetical protein